jgi:hypothetical protein
MFRKLLQNFHRRLSGVIAAWQYACIVAVCLQRGSMLAAWQYACSVAVCLQHVSILAAWQYACNVAVCLQRGSMLAAEAWQPLISKLPG